MIKSAEEFVTLRRSLVQAEYYRSAHEEASEEVWKAVIAEYPDMRTWVAHNKTVPISILRLLMEDADADVWKSVARKRKLTNEMYDKLAGDPNDEVRISVLRNPNVTNAVVRRLIDDLSPWVAATAREVMGKRGGKV